MINFSYTSDFKLVNTNKYYEWLNDIILSEGRLLGELCYIFCDDDYLLEINRKFLQHNYYTDIITFDYTDGKVISGDVYISIDRVNENSETFGVSFDNELLRVMAHGVLHLLGYGDKENDEIKIMRSKEDEKIKLFHVER